MYPKLLNKGSSLARHIVSCMALMGLTLMLALPASAEYFYYITDLGTLGGTVSRAYGINNQTPPYVVGQSTTAGGETHAFLYQGGTMTDLGVLPGGTGSNARGVNGSGHVAGFATAPDAKNHAFFYNGSGMLDLGTLGAYPCDAAAINSASQMVGTCNTTSRSDSGHPFLYSEGTGIVDILGSGWTYGVATAINDLGQVVGYGRVAGSSAYRSFLYNPGSGMTDLGTMGGTRSNARSINSAGQVVGEYTTTAGLTHAFFYNGSSAIDLGTLGGDKSYAKALNTKGEVVGQTQVAGNVNTPFIWSPTSGGMINLATVVGNNEDWYLSDALAINDAGYIVGTGSINNQTHAYLLTPVAPLVITTESLYHGNAGSSYTAKFAATGGVPAYTWSIVEGLLPSGISMNSTGAFSGYPTVWGSFDITVEVVDSVGIKVEKAYTLVIDPPNPLVMNAKTLPNGTVGSSYNQTLTATGGVPTYSYELVSGTLPPGIELVSSSTTCALRGTPTTASAAPYSFTVQVRDSFGTTATRTYAITVVIGSLSVTTSSLPNATLYSSYSRTLAATGGLKPYTWTNIEGVLPTGLILNTTTGTISGIPTEYGTFPIKVQVQDTMGTTATRNLTITVGIGTLTITTSSLANAKVGSLYNRAVAASGGVKPYAWQIVGGTFPPGLILNETSGAISGRPTAAGTYVFTVQVKDARPVTATKQFTIVVSP